MNYDHTHVSYFDGSPAMLVREAKGMVRMMNECGDQWSDPASRWIPIGQETQADYDRWRLPEDDDEGYYFAGTGEWSEDTSYEDYLNRD